MSKSAVHCSATSRRSIGFLSLRQVGGAASRGTEELRDQEWAGANCSPKPGGRALRNDPDAMKERGF
jgi:hypothetical protein